ncbi:phosphoribosyltransferase family protein [Pseudovibrio exalbescens]|uniref:phosphoribosyltransferase family protein n=1 Tax=Pseudovibrio exalbescens TaxID=197461 RepID=UPI000C9B23B7|nr:phosphoribosyltransferase family protein [Pseudovibrio exalbescens]
MTGTDQDALKLLREIGAVVDGHFILPSGLSSPTLIDRPRLFMYPCHLQALCALLCRELHSQKLTGFDRVVSISRANMVLGHEVARQMGCPSTWLEKEAGSLKLVGPNLEKKTRLLIVEDVVNTGASSQEAIHALESWGMEAVGVACVINRSNGQANLELPIISLIDMQVPAYALDQVPRYLEEIPAIVTGNVASGH